MGREDRPMKRRPVSKQPASRARRDGMAYYSAKEIVIVGKGTADLRGLPADFIGAMPARISESPYRLHLLTTTPPESFTSFPVETQAHPRGATFQDVPRVWLGTHQAVLAAARLLLDAGIEPAEGDGDGDLLDRELDWVATTKNPAYTARWLRDAQRALDASAALLPERMAKGRVVSADYPTQSPVQSVSLANAALQAAAHMGVMSASFTEYFNTPTPASHTLVDRDGRITQFTQTAIELSRASAITVEDAMKSMGYASGLFASKQDLTDSVDLTSYIVPGSLRFDA